MLAFAFLARPSVLLYDEPTAGIDEAGEEQLYERIHRLKQEHRFALLLISHELSLVYRYDPGAVSRTGAKLGRAADGGPDAVGLPGIGIAVRGKR